VSDPGPTPPPHPASPVPEHWETHRLVENVLVAVSAATAALSGWLDAPILCRDLKLPETPEDHDYLYRIAGAYAFATSVLEHFCEETGQSPLKVLQHIGMQANLMLVGSEEEDDPEDPSPPLEGV
jgi:hypothetical protein